MKLDLSQICDVKIEGIDRLDCPDYVDAFISEAWIEIEFPEFILHPQAMEYNGKYFRPLTDSELDYLNDTQREFVYKHTMKFIF